MILPSRTPTDSKDAIVNDENTSPEPSTAGPSGASPTPGDPDARVRPYSPARTMPTGFEISLKEKGGTDRQLLNPPTERRQSMRGFEDKYVDIIDYIVRITHEIWEEKNIGYIYDTYRHNSRVIDDSGLQYGRDKIVADTVHTINAFPDVRLYADELVWAGDDVTGFHTSHRTVIVGHNTGYSKYGPPTGRRIAVWCIANCVALENEIYEEHVIYNNSSMLMQLGYDLRTKAREMGNAAAALDSLRDARFGEAERVLGQGKPAHLPDLPEDRFDPETFLRHTYHYVWNWRNLSRIEHAYAPGLRYYGPSGREFYGRGEYKSFILSLLATFPDLALNVDDVYYMGNDDEGYLTSIRWSAVATHRGYGLYGRPTGRRVHLWGICQQRIRDGVIHEEWMMFNEFEVMQQIYRDEPFADA
ncbi:SnoaL-like polyketide cyclase [Streptomyces sp. YIM 130001]|uniref:nuclear transport factor 2 family protein n=1 Tax=Streptomyces sp. YIM 130001 TaxID=2259644 RepID=UPI000E64F816|nr:ester cyclase [Streptomyces sp. YIM 130001]RII16084.1 SnoaL-like polyketide cyclase [Streptomyces sp. YIM 130001]